ncbi:hypothetical protein AB0A77_04350 [Streptomyces varsoviensis]|uniref:hypothetical protein n=1 Tax=Streptomyces varsoviensis TaxID=67373 RepID=UPI0033C825DA
MNIESTGVAPAACEAHPADLVVIDELDRWTVPAGALSAQTWICIREDRGA